MMLELALIEKVTENLKKIQNSEEKNQLERLEQKAKLAKDRVKEKQEAHKKENHDRLQRIYHIKVKNEEQEREAKLLREKTLAEKNERKEKQIQERERERKEKAQARKLAVKMALLNDK